MWRTLQRTEDARTRSIPAPRRRAGAVPAAPRSRSALPLLAKRLLAAGRLSSELPQLQAAWQGGTGLPCSLPSAACCQNSPCSFPEQGGTIVSFPGRLAPVSACSQETGLVARPDSCFSQVPASSPVLPISPSAIGQRLLRQPAAHRAPLAPATSPVHPPLLLLRKGVCLDVHRAFHWKKKMYIFGRV